MNSLQRISPPALSSYLPAYARGCRFFNLAFNYSLFGGRVDLNVGILNNNYSFHVRGDYGGKWHAISDS
jgi:hypothetical protein